MSVVRSPRAVASSHGSWLALSAALLAVFAAGCGGIVEQGLSGDQSVSQPDDETTELDETGIGGNSDLGDAARRDVENVDLAACEAFTTQVCRLQMRYGEGSGGIDATLEVRRVGERRLSVTDGPGSESPWEEVVDVGLDGTLETEAGVPEVTCEHLVERYAGEEGPETYEQVAGYPCSEADAALIRFFVREWFYFG